MAGGNECVKYVQIEKQYSFNPKQLSIFQTINKSNLLKKILGEIKETLDLKKQLLLNFKLSS